MEVDLAGGGGGGQIAPCLMQSLMLWLITIGCRVGTKLCLSQLTLHPARAPHSPDPVVSLVQESLTPFYRDTQGQKLISAGAKI